MITSDIEKFELYIRTELCLSKETLSAYMRDVKEFLCYAESQKLNSELIRTFIDSLHGLGLKQSTVRRKCMSIRCFCHHMVSSGLLDKNILGMIDAVKVEREALDGTSIVEDRDVDALLSSLEMHTPTSRTNNIRRDSAIILIMYHSGLRVSEVCSLNLSDINFSQRQILVKGKGGNERIVPTTFRCVSYVRKYIESERPSGVDYLFVKADGGRITRRAISCMLVSISTRAGIKQITAHVLRRSCATSLMKRGVELDLVRDLLGHQHLSTTQAYLIIDNEHLKRTHGQCHPFGEKHGIK